MKLHEEFKLYENMWDEPTAETLEEKKAKPVTKRRLAHAAIGILTHLFIAALGGASLAGIGTTIIVSYIITDIFEAIDFHKATKNYPGIKQLIKKSKYLRHDIFKLIDEAGVEKTAAALEAFDNYVKRNPQILEDDTVEAILDITYDPITGAKNIDISLAGDGAPDPSDKFTESLTEDTDNLSLSMEDFLQALTDMKAEYGEDHIADVNEINDFMLKWKTENKEVSEA
jgi:hypothetical protein